ncbi:DUF1501 domain-containing protein [Solitalea canadensis]|uniref:Twin-arginine translocation pathway signal n=1 Tax=Solitalea canadensis (strain ATCC 29591 / DSM 3403 / JCM 21819 / LMG 8368 / NBRC 15130 / NCIMB 12057 / USAM 9D) TaxID=929556 RepID=H8KKX7_SOLCM|nr:DUF1501 domain-containing protein [Solitalea canadensis]AFD08794.1 hypothetical protein Solca_3795 [Solitalea canadensis DSM 3403]
MNRRDFLKNTALASGALLIPSFLKPLELLAADKIGFKRLVIIQLSGGNDGLNTIVPFGDDLYYQKRPSLGIDQQTVIKLNELQGFNPAMQSLQEIYDQGWMTILNSVGYPNPDRSHFRSMDIWHTASRADEYLSTGWIGRYLDSNCATCNSPHTAIEVDDSLSLALKGQSHKGIAVRNSEQLYRTTREPFFKDVVDDAKQSMLSEDNLGYLYKTMIETYSSAKYINDTSKLYKNTTLYPVSAFANELKTVATFINSGLNTKVFYVSLSGFDTHVAQRGQQSRLLKTYADGVATFIKDLNASHNLDDTLVLTFSEFGRRVSQNASGGTDHGTANNLFLFGGKLKKAGFFNPGPNLKDLDNGDLNYEINFRDVYSSILQNWLKASDPSIIKSTRVKTLDLLKI